jgi:agmatinase
MMTQNLVTIFGCGSAYETADIALFGAPFDSTTSYRPGARFGPGSIRNESYGLESYSPYLDKDVADLHIIDLGDLNLSIGDARLSLAQIERQAELLLNDGKLPFMIGGEHLVTLGAVRAVAAKYPDLHIIHFDAHADLRDDYLGVSLSHASVMRRCHEFLGDGRIHQFGIRSFDRDEMRWGLDHIDTQRFTLAGVDKLVGSLGAAPVYLTVDLDVMDPGIFPGTGTPEAGGVSFNELRLALMAACRANIVGLDVVELCPSFDPSGISTATACKIIRELLLSLKGVSRWERH